MRNSFFPRIKKRKNKMKKYYIIMQSMENRKAILSGVKPDGALGF